MVKRSILTISILLCAIFVTCKEKEKPPEQIEQIVSEPREPEITEEEPQIVSAVQENTEVKVSYSVQRPLPVLPRGGRVNTYEINPINYENPDFEVMKEMGVQQYIILYLSGEQFYKKGDYDRAIGEYTAAINNNREFIEAFISRGNAWMKKKEYNRAIDDFTLSIRLDSGRAELYNYRGFARTEIAVRGNRSYFNLAIEDYTRAIALNSNYVDALINRSHAYYQTGNYDRVIEDCNRIIRLEPRNAYIWNRRGSAWYSKADDDKAISDFSEAIRLKADYKVALLNRANAWQSKGDQNKANADLEAAKKL
jgi:tetratricopeptide (TPR) repeat protein